jgi:hypothetical protein
LNEVAHSKSPQTTQRHVLVAAKHHHESHG